MSDLKKELRLALSSVDESLLNAEEERKRLISFIRSSTKRKVQEAIENNLEILSVIERIDRLVLFHQILRNIRMNLTVFQKGNLELRPNQLQSIHKLIAFLQAEGYGSTTGYIKQPTGAGKTVLFGVLTHLCNVQTIILVPKVNLLNQTKKELIEVVGIPEEMIGLVSNDYKEYEKSIRIVTYQSHRSLMVRDAKYRNIVQSCQLVVCDEAHRSLGRDTQASLEMLDGEFDELLTVKEQEAEDDVLVNLDKYTPSRALKIGFTATPKLANKHVEDAFGYMIAEEMHADLVKAGILVPYKIVHSDGTITEDDLEDGYLSINKEIEVLHRENSYQKLLGEYIGVLAKFKKAKKKQQYPLRGAAFCVKISECDRFAREAKALGLRTRTVTSRETKGMSQEDADALLAQAEKQLMNQEIDLVITVSKLAEGWNFPPANAAIWARASMSPALIIQGVGRTARAFEDEQGRKKVFSTVFETNWHMEEKRKRTPLTIADALAQMGENPKDFCEMADGSEVKINNTVRLNENGTVLVGDRLAVGPAKYSLHLQFGEGRIRDLIKEAGLTPIPDVRAYSNLSPVNIFWKDEVDALLPRQLDKYGVVEIDGKEAVAIYPYAAANDLGLSWQPILNLIVEAGLVKIPNLRVFSGDSPVDVYWKDEVDALLPKHLNEKGIVMVNGRAAVGLKPYANSLEEPINPKCLYAYAKEAGILPVTDLVIRSGSRSKPTTVYWKDEIDALIPKRIDDDGAVKINGRAAVCLTVYVEGKIDPRVALKDLEGKEIMPVEGARVLNRSKMVDVYWKTDVDRILRERGRL
jgi:superfamily II DNA or RNA helicase